MTTTLAPPVAPPSTPAGLLEVRDLEAGYGELVVIRGISVSFAPRKITTIIGANGAGKSTLLRTIFGLVRIRSGCVIYDGSDITSWRSRRILGAGIVYAPQGRCNFPVMTVEDNLRVSLDGHRAGGDYRHRLEQLFDESPMLARARRAMAGNLSGGQQQILEIAMSMLHEPRVLLIDEPSLGLSPAMLDEVFAQIVAIRNQGVTVVMVEQNAKQALANSDRGVVLEMGRLLMDGEAQALLTHPAIRRAYLGG